MISFLLWCIGLWSVFMSLSLFDTCVRADEVTDPYERAKYYLDGLMKSLEEIETSHVLHKRSATEHQNEVFLSLASLCLKLDNKSRSKATKGTNESKVKVENDSVSSIRPKVTTRDPISIWTKPAVFPVKVKAERDGTNVRITFDVINESPASVARVESFDYQKKVIDTDRNTSKVQFLEDAKRCKPDQNYAYYFFFLENDRYFANARVDICRFDKVYNENMTTRQEKWELRNESVFSQVVPQPRFRISKDPGDKFFISQGENPIFEVDIVLYRGCDFHIAVSLWDWKTNSYVSSVVDIDLLDDKTKLLEVKHRKGSRFLDNLLRVDVLSEIVLNDTTIKDKHYSERRYLEVYARVRVTVNIGFEKMSGKIGFSYNWGESNWYVRPVVRSVDSTREIELRLLYKVSVYPRNKVFWVEAYDDKCRVTDNRNCTIQCYAWGPDIQAIFIVKASPYRLPVRTTSYVLGGSMGFVKQDVGPASEDNQGTYQCLVMSSNGNIQQKDFRLFTSLFTKVKNVSVENYSNGTSLFKCSAYGAQPLNITVEVADIHYKNKERIDNKTGSAPILETVENETNLTLLLETDMLRYPHFYLTCRANGERGSHSSDIYLRDIIPNHHDALIPNMKKNESSITKYGDDKSKIVCSASGGKDLEMSILYGEPDRIRIDQKSGNVRTVTETNDGKTLTLIVPTSSIPEEKHWLSCKAENEFGQKWTSFNLHDYFKSLGGGTR